MEEFLKNWMLNYHQYAYLILFLWCILEGELALILGGILAHKGYIDIRLAIFIAGLGAFVGDQIYFYIGRYNQKFITKKLEICHRTPTFATLWLDFDLFATLFIWISHDYPDEHRHHTLQRAKICFDKSH